MARIALNGVTTLNTGTHLDPQTLDLYSLRELISTPAFTAGVAFPAYTAANAKFLITSGGSFQLLDDQQVQWGGSAYAVVGNAALGYLDFYAANTRLLRFTSTGAALFGRTTQLSGGKVEIAGNLALQPSASAPTLGANGDMSFQLVSNTSLKILVRGSDGVTRSATLTLA